MFSSKNKKNINIIIWTHFLARAMKSLPQEKQIKSWGMGQAEQVGHAGLPLTFYFKIPSFP